MVLNIRKEFAKHDPDDSGTITIQDCGEALKNCK